MNRNPTFQLSCVCLADSVLSRRWNGRVRRGRRSAAHRLEDGEKKEASHGDPSLNLVLRVKRVVFPFFRWAFTSQGLLTIAPISASDSTQQTLRGALIELNSLYWHIVEHFCINRKWTVILRIFPFLLLQLPTCFWSLLDTVGQVLCFLAVVTEKFAESFTVRTGNPDD